MIKKLLYIFGLCVLLTTLYFVGRWYLAMNEPVIQTTGAVISPPSDDELEPYRQMYELLDKGIVRQPTFEIRPIPKKRIFEVKLNTPSNKSKVDFQIWLKENGYDGIPSNKFFFVY